MHDTASLTPPPGTSWDDDGFYGPGSIAWRIIGHPAAIIGGMRALMVQALEPHAMAGVFSYSDFNTRPVDRLRRTMRYVGTVTFGSTADATSAAQLVRRVHEQVQGIDPVTGTPFSAVDPDTLLWVHMAEYHSFLAAYEAFAGPLSTAEADEYFRTTARAVEALGTPIELVPTTRADVRDYFAQMRPKLCLSDLARESIDFIRFPPLTRELLAIQVPIRVASAAAVSILPSYVRRLIGVHRPRIADLPTRVGVLAAVQGVSIGLKLAYGSGSRHIHPGHRARRLGFLPYAVEHGHVDASDIPTRRPAAA